MLNIGSGQESRATPLAGRPTPTPTASTQLRRKKYMDDDALEALLGDDDAPAASSLPPMCVRVHRLTQAQAERICKWAKRLHRVDVLCDVTLPAGERALALLRYALKENLLEGKVRIVTFTSADMEKRYPHLRHEALEAYRREHPWMMLAMSHAWAYTAEGMVVCGLGLDHDVPDDAHVWVFEHDCDFGGPIEALISAYDDDDADLIAKRLIAEDKFDEWMWHDCATPSFLDKYGSSRCVAHVHACRISARLLRALHSAALDGLIGYGEMALPTVCVGEGMTWRPLRQEHIGEPYDPHGHMGRDDFAEQESAPSLKLIHALKW